MAKTAVNQWDQTAGNNTDVGGVSIAEGMAPSDVNDALREIMAQVREWPVAPGLVAGIVPTNDSDADHDISFSIGVASDSSYTQMLDFDTALVKQIDFNWAAGTGAGGFPSGLTLSADTWYHLFVIGQTDGTIDAGFDTSLTASFLLTDAVGYTLYRRVGSVLTDSSSNILAFTATESAGGGLFFEWADPPLDLNSSAITTSATTATLSTPTGYKTKALLNAMGQIASGHSSIYVRSTAANDEAPDQAAAPLANVAGFFSSNGIGQSQVTVMTDTSSQVTVRASAASTTVRLSTVGWDDFRR